MVGGLVLLGLPLFAAEAYRLRLSPFRFPRRCVENGCMSEVPFFQTPRLVARHWSMDIAEQALTIYGDPEVTKFLWGQHYRSLDEMKEKIEWIMERNTKFAEGLGSFPVFLRESGQMVGTALIKNLPDNEENFTSDIEIGWHLARRHWGKGFATEFGRALLQIGFEHLDLDVLHAVVDLENEASKNVARRLGMRHLGQTTRYYSGDAIEHFVLDKSEWLAAQNEAKLG